MSRPEPPAVVRARVVAYLRRAVPELALEEAEQALVAVNAHRHVGLHRLDDHLRQHPDALRSGDAATPPSLHRLLRHLHAAGHQVTVPACARCGKQRRLPERSPQGRICSSCAAAGRMRACIRCDVVRVVASVLPEGPLCSSCVAADPSRHERCSVCERRARVNRRLADGRPVCAACAQRPAEPCSSCGRTGLVARRLETGPLCDSCYRAHRLPRECGLCGRTTVIRVRARNGAPELCRSCAKGPVAVCVGCRRVRPCTGLRAGVPRCSSCRSQPVVPCTRCGQHKRRRARWPLGGVCASCYGYIRSHPRPCATCGRTRPLVGPGPGGRGTCGVCSGAPNAYLCSTCGSGRETERGARCARCIVRDRLATEFLSSRGEVPAEVRPLLEALVRAPRARSILVWLDKPRGGAACLRRLLDDDLPLTHETLDSAGPGQGASVVASHPRPPRCPSGTQ
ncbi:hypothetical protein SVIRM249S_07090 [Streptomyces viridochromogenes]